MAKIVLPSGAWVCLRDVDEIRNRQRRDIAAAVEALVGGQATRAFDSVVVAAAVLITDWSLEAPRPLLVKTADGVYHIENGDALDDELSLADYNVLTGALKELTLVLNAGFEPTPDRDSPTPASSG